MYDFGMALGNSLRSSILFAIGQLDKAKVYRIIRTHMKYFTYTILVIKICFFAFHQFIARLFFSDPEMVALFSKMLLIYSFILVFEPLNFIIGTLLRTFEMNKHTTIIFFFYSFPFSVQIYVYLHYYDLKHLSPLYALIVCNVCIISCYFFFLFKNTDSNLDKIIKSFGREFTVIRNSNSISIN